MSDNDKRGRGRPPGRSNNKTIEFRVSVQKLLDDNRENMTLWLRQVAAESPDKALGHLTRLAEFAAPKLARTELVGDGGGPVRVVATPADQNL